MRATRVLHDARTRATARRRPARAGARRAHGRRGRDRARRGAAAVAPAASSARSAGSPSRASRCTSSRPALLETLSSARRPRGIAPGWLAAMAVLQAGAMVCLWALQRIAMHTTGWYAVATSQLAGNGMSKVAPGGGAVGAALQYRMLVQAGIDRPRAVSGLTAVEPADAGHRARAPGAGDAGAAQRRRRPRPRPRGRRRAGRLRASCSRVGVADARVRRAAAAHRPARAARRATGCARAPSRSSSCRRGCCASATGSSRTVGARWKAALATGVARWALDYASLLAALAAVGSDAPPGPGAARVLRGAAARADPGHARRARLRRGRARRDARPRRRRRRRRGARDVRLPAVHASGCRCRSGSPGPCFTGGGTRRRGAGALSACARSGTRPADACPAPGADATDERAAERLDAVAHVAEAGAGRDRARDRTPRRRRRPRTSSTWLWRSVIRRAGRPARVLGDVLQRLEAGEVHRALDLRRVAGQARRTSTSTGSGARRATLRSASARPRSASSAG